MEDADFLIYENPSYAKRSHNSPLRWSYRSFILHLYIYDFYRKPDINPVNKQLGQNSAKMTKMKFNFNKR